MILMAIEQFVKRMFASHFGDEDKRFNFEGQNILAREIIKKMVLKVLEYDQKRTPFKILGVEADDKKGYILNIPVEVDRNMLDIGMKGIIDRIEQKDEVIRIVDYKTGQDEKSFIDIPSLFDRENKKRNKAVFQTFFYGLLYLSSTANTNNYRIQASLFNIRELFKSDFSPLIQFKKKDVQDIKIYLDEYEMYLKDLLIEIFNPEISFSQTSDTKKCDYCPYVGICNR